MKNRIDRLIEDLTELKNNGGFVIDYHISYGSIDIQRKGEKWVKQIHDGTFEIQINAFIKKQQDERRD